VTSTHPNADFDTRETAAVLAGLRLLQQQADSLPAEIRAIYTDDGQIEHPLDGDGIDMLCERINGLDEG